MKPNYYMYLVVFIVILFRGRILIVFNNIESLLINRSNNIETSLLKRRVEELEENYNDLITFKNKINIEEEYTITNVYKNNYGFDKLIVNGIFNIGDEVINEDGLVGIIDKAYPNYSEIKYIYDTNLAIKIKDINGKIIGKDDYNNLIIKELSNYNDININDEVYSASNIFIGKVIEVKRLDFDTCAIVKPISLNNISYVAVISRMKWY